MADEGGVVSNRAEIGEEVGSSYALAHLPWTDVARRLARDPRLILPVGSLEQHGAHLPLGTNTFIADRLSDLLSRESRVLKAPALVYGVGVPRGRGYAGTASLRRKTLHRALNELCASWEDHGVTEFILMTAHRYEPHLDALLMANTTKSTTLVVDLYSIDVGDVLDGGAEGEHGGELETSLMLHLAPHLVHQDRIADFVPGPKQYRRYVKGRVPTPPPGSGGIVGSPSRANAEKGERLVQRYLEALRTVVPRRS